MRRIYLALIIASMLPNLTALSQTKKSETFYDYQSERQYKGVKFGSMYTDIKSRVGLKAGDAFGDFDITKIDYLTYNGITFPKGIISFNPDDRMYKVNLFLFSEKSLLKEYTALKNSLINLFGKNDKEFFVSQNESMNATWSGKNLDIIIHYSISPNTRNITLQIVDNTFSNFGSNDMIKARDKNKIPKI